MRVKLGDKGQPQGCAEDFITGRLAPGETKKGRWMGRSVGIVFGGDGSMYLSDDSGRDLLDHIREVILHLKELSS